LVCFRFYEFKEIWESVGQAHGRVAWECRAKKRKPIACGEQKIESRKRDDCHPGFRDLQLDAAQPAGARTKAALKPPHSKRWRECESPGGGGASGARNGFRRPCATLGFRFRCASARQAGSVAARPMPPRQVLGKNRLTMVSSCHDMVNIQSESGAPSPGSLISPPPRPLVNPIMPSYTAFTSDHCKVIRSLHSKERRPVKTPFS